MAKYRSYQNRIEYNTRSAANAGWAGAGVGAVGALQAARGARAAEELAALARVGLQQSADAAEQTRMFQFATWRQTREGAAFMAWRDPAFKLAQFLRNRDAEWSEGWARVIASAQSEVPVAEVQRIVRQPALLKRTGLKVGAVLSFILAVLFGFGMIFQMLVASIPHSTSSSDFTYADCLTALAKPNTIMTAENCDAIKPAGSAPVIGQAVPAALLLGVGITLLVVRKRVQRAARADQTLAVEAQARIARWGFDPMAAAPGYTPFTWYESRWYENSSANVFADKLMTLALYNGHGEPPTPSQLIKLVTPVSNQPHDVHPAEANTLLTRFAAERPTFG